MSTPLRGRPMLGVLADDLTGAHASAARLRAGGHRAVVVWEPAGLPRAVDALVAEMGTRDGDTPPAARAATWTEALCRAGCTRLELRVDTTLRGDAAPELAGLVAAAGLDDPIVVAVPAFPDAGRVTVDGYQHVRHPDGTQQALPVAERIFPASDPDSAVLNVDIATLERGPAAVADRIAAAARGGRRYTVVDAVTDEHLALAAAAVERLHSGDRPVVTVSSGAWLRHYPAPPGGAFVLVVLASPTAANRAQLAALTRTGDTTVRTPDQVAADPAGALTGPAGTLVVETLSAGDDGPRAAEAAARAARTLLTAAHAAGRRCCGIVVTGGHAAACLAAALDAETLEPSGEVAPLCPRGRIGGGPWAGLPLITKGGVIGDPATLRHLVDALTSTPPEPTTLPHATLEDHYG